MFFYLKKILIERLYKCKLTEEICDKETVALIILDTIEINKYDNKYQNHYLTDRGFQAERRLVKYFANCILSNLDTEEQVNIYKKTNTILKNLKIIHTPPKLPESFSEWCNFLHIAERIGATAGFDLIGIDTEYKILCVECKRSKKYGELEYPPIKIILTKNELTTRVNIAKFKTNSIKPIWKLLLISGNDSSPRIEEDYLYDVTSFFNKNAQKIIDLSFDGSKVNFIVKVNHLDQLDIL